MPESAFRVWFNEWESRLGGSPKAFYELVSKVNQGVIAPNSVGADLYKAFKERDISDSRFARYVRAVVVAFPNDPDKALECVNTMREHFNLEPLEKLPEEFRIESTIPPPAPLAVAEPDTTSLPSLAEVLSVPGGATFDPRCLAALGKVVSQLGTLNFVQDLLTVSDAHGIRLADETVERLAQEGLYQKVLSVNQQS